MSAQFPTYIVVTVFLVTVTPLMEGPDEIGIRRRATAYVTAKLVSDIWMNRRWQEHMAPFFEGSGDHADQMMDVLDEVFHLD